MTGIMGMALILGVATACAQSYFWTGSGTDSLYSDPANWATSVVPPSGSTLVFNADVATGPFGSALTLDSAISVGAIDVEAGAFTGDSIQFNGPSKGGFGITLGTPGLPASQTLDVAGSSARFNVPLTLATSQTWAIVNADLVLNSPISELAAGAALTLKNTGGVSLILFNAGSSTYSGGTIVTGPDAVVAVSASSSGPAGAPTAGPLGTGPVILGNGTVLASASSGTVTLGNDIVAGIGPGPSTVTLAGRPGGLFVLTGTISDPASGTGAVLAAPAGTIDFEGDNTYSGGTTLDFTTVIVGTDHGLGTGALNATDSIVTFRGDRPVIDNLTMTGTSLNFADNSAISIIDMTSDARGSMNSINAGNNSALDLTVDAPTAYFGIITGSNGSVTYQTSGSGVIDLLGASTYTGKTNIDANVLVIADNNAALGDAHNPVALNGGGSALGIGANVTVSNKITKFADGSILEGYGAFDPSATSNLTVDQGSVIVGGKGSLPLGGFSSSNVPGTLTFGSGVKRLTLGDLGVMQFSIMNAGGMAGTDFSTIYAPNTQVFVTASPSTPFAIQLVSVNPGTGQAGLANFNDMKAYTWALITGSSISGFSPSSFTVDATTDFQNALGGGTFSVIQLGNQIDLSFTPVPEPGTWALLGLGTGVVGVAALRRRTKAKAVFAN